MVHNASQLHFQQTSQECRSYFCATCNEVHTSGARQIWKRTILAMGVHRASQMHMQRILRCGAIFVNYNIRDRGAECLTNVLVTNSTLLELYLYLHNNICDRRTVLRRITQYLKLNKNAIKSKSAFVAVCASVIMSPHQNYWKQEAEVVEEGDEGSVFPARSSSSASVIFGWPNRGRR